MLTVTAPSTPIVFCEGISGGLDTVFLHQIIPAGPQIKPVGGKEAMRAFIEGHIAGYATAQKRPQGLNPWGLFCLHMRDSE